MKRKMMLTVAVSGAFAVAGWSIAPHHKNPGVTAVQPGAPTQSGYVVHLDDRGRVTAQASPADRAQLDAALANSVNTSSQGLVERPSPVAGGGMIMDLQGRFECAAVAAIDADGKITEPCLTNEAETRAFTSSTAAPAADGKE